MASGTPTGRRYPEATTLFQCSFDEKDDVNFDQWPDVWTRRRGPGFPLYLNLKILESPGPEGGRSLEFSLDGGAAATLSPPIPIDPANNCLLEVWIKTEGLRYDHAFASITYLDAKDRALETIPSERLGGTSPWTKIRLGPLACRHPTARFALVGLHLEPEVPEIREDLRGKAAFTGVWLGRVPRMEFSTGGSRLFTDPHRVELTCTAWGCTAPSPMLSLKLTDAPGRELAGVERPMQPVKPEGGSKEPVARAAWKLPLPGPGFYRVVGQLKGFDALCQESASLAVIEPLAGGPGSPFGWTLSRVPGSAEQARLLPVLREAGLGWIKLPMWYGPKRSGSELDELIHFLEQLPQIEPIGVLDNPPEDVRKRLSGANPITAADVFTSPPETWRASLEPMMSRLAGQVHWWQLGDDRDRSFIDFPGLAGKLLQTRTMLGRIGGEVNVGMPWAWQNELPPAPAKNAWQFLCLSADPPLDADELACYLEASRGGPVMRLVDVEPLAAGRYGVEVRATDLVRRMVEAKIHGADGMFVPQPIDGRQGMVAADGSPGEMFLPWRTAALALGAGRCLGALELPGGSTNYLFSGQGGTVMAIWNRRPCEEVLYLGEQARQHELWGRSAPVPLGPRGQTVAVKPAPSFVTGLSEPVARWRMATELGTRRIQSVYGQTQPNVLRLKNTFPQAINCVARFASQDGLVVEPRQVEFRAARDGAFQSPLQLTLQTQATSGRHLLRIDFEVQADRAYRFAAYRSLDVGLGDVYIETRTHLNARGELVVEQEFVNTTAKRVNFRCRLLVPGRQIQTSDVIDLASGRDLRTYLLPKGEELIGGKVWIRADEVDGLRVLNYRIVAER